MGISAGHPRGAGHDWEVHHAGLERMDITDGHKNEIEHQIYETFRETGGRHVILSPGCVIRYPLDPDMLSFVRKAKEEIETKLLGTSD